LRHMWKNLNGPFNAASEVCNLLQFCLLTQSPKYQKPSTFSSFEFLRHRFNLHSSGVN